MRLLFFSGLVPLHNACSYGHLEVAELLLSYGAEASVSDLWKFSPLHEAAAKGKFDLCKLLLSRGADAKKKNRDGQTPLDLVKDGDEDVADLLRGKQELGAFLLKAIRLRSGEKVESDEQRPI